MKNVYVFGEIHTERSNVEYIQKRIAEIKPQYLLHELLYEDACYTSAQIKERIKNCAEGSVCDPRLNKDIYELGLKFNINLIGIDVNDPAISKLSAPKQFALREKHMSEIISRFINLKNNPKIVVVVGDTHLREKGNGELGKSPLVSLFEGNPKVILERVPENIREMD